MTLEIMATLIANIGVQEAIKKLVGTAVETHIKPILQNHADYKDNTVELEDCLREYLEMSYKKAMEMNTIVFRGLYKSLCDLYIPLTLTRTFGMNIEEYKMNDKYYEILEKHEKISIIDTAGMGKSTIVKYLAVQAINDEKYIPIIIELRKIEKNEDLFDYIIEQFDLMDKKVSKLDLIKMLKRGDFIIFFDGYDEITNENRGGILDNIQDFTKKAGKNQYILTSRDENDLNCLGEFQRFSIKPLSIEEAFDLINKYDDHGEKSKILIEKIKKDEQLNLLKEFLVNPMLTSLLYKTFEYKEEIAYKKLGFYGQVYEALFNDHDKTKGSAYVHPKQSKLDMWDFERLLRRIAFMSLRLNKVEYTKQELLENIEKTITNMLWINVSAIKVLDDLTHSVPFFQKDGNDYKWIHKSFMEYFAAGYICFEYEQPKELIKKMISSQYITKYKNVLDFCYDIKPDIAMQIIVYSHISEFVEIYEKTYSAPEYSSYDFLSVDFRKSRSFTHEYNLIHYDSIQKAEEAFGGYEDARVLFSKGRNCDLSTLTRLSIPDLIAHGTNNKFHINELLLSKGIDIFKTVKLDKCKEIVMQIKKGPFEISDDLKLIINKKEEYFLYVTRLLQYIDPNAPYLDYEKCRALKEKIERDSQEMEFLEKDFDI